MSATMQLPTLELGGLVSGQGTHELHFRDEKGWVRRLLLTDDVKLILAGLMSLATPEAAQNKPLQGDR